MIEEEQKKKIENNEWANEIIEWIGIQKQRVNYNI